MLHFVSFDRLSKYYTYSTRSTGTFQPSIFAHFLHTFCTFYYTLFCTFSAHFFNKFKIYLYYYLNIILTITCSGVHFKVHFGVHFGVHLGVHSEVHFGYTLGIKWERFGYKIIIICYNYHRCLICFFQRIKMIVLNFYHWKNIKQI